MTWRKWLVRGLVFNTFGGIAVAALLYQLWTNPVATRRQVLSQLDRVFIGAHVRLDSARLRLLGGISISDLRMAHRDDLERTDFLYVPDGIIYLDKERLANGDLAIRKIELQRVRLRVLRDREGRWNVANLLSPPNLNERVPMLVFKQATIVIEDQTTPLAGPLLEIKDVNLTVINDPLPTLAFEGNGLSDVAGPVHVSGKMQRATCDVALDLDASAIPIGPALVKRLAGISPAVAAHVQNLHGEGRLKASFTNRPANPQSLRYDATLTLTHGEFSHERLPWTLQGIEATARLVNGAIPLAHLAARSGPSKFDVTLKDLSLSRDFTIKEDGSFLTDLVREMDARLEHVPVNDKLFDYLPPDLQDLKDDYSPSGFMSLTHTFRKDESGRWHKRWLLTAEGMQATYKLFPYTVERITGTADVEYENEMEPVVKLDLTGYGRDRPIMLKGVVYAAKSNCGIEIDIAGEKVPLDNKLYQALQPSCQRLIEQFMPVERGRDNKTVFAPRGFGDFKVMLRRRRGFPDLDKSFFITFHDAALRYVAFPYPLENVSGVLELYPDHWEAKKFRGTHNGGEITFSSLSHPPAGSTSAIDRPDWVRVDLQGHNIKLDDPDFLGALASRKTLHHTWTMLHLAGHMNFEAKIVDIPGQPEEDINVGVTIDGCRMRPEFFQYTMEDVSGSFQYAQKRLYLNDVKAKHGQSVLRLTKGEVILKPNDTGFQVRLDAIQGTPVVPDDDFVNALPTPVGEPLKAIKLRNPLYAGTALIVDVGPDPNETLFWWDGGVFLSKATLQAGLELSGLDGLVTCCGLKKGSHLEMLGNVALKTATLLNQPVQDVHARFYVQKDSPNELRIRDLTAQLYGGVLGGEGHVTFGPTLEYDMTLKAMNVQLEQFGRHNFGADADMQGPVSAALHLKGEGRDIGGLKGNGNVFATTAKLYKLPRLLDLIKAFGLRLPDRTAFEQASAWFTIDGPQVRVDQLDLVGNAISLRGQGTVDLNGNNLNLDFNADWARLGQFLPEALSWGPRLLSDQLLKVKVRGRVGDMRFEPEIVPAVQRIFGNDK
jgi:AsmA-like C-terminal region